MLKSEALPPNTRTDEVLIIKLDSLGEKELKELEAITYGKIRWEGKLSLYSGGEAIEKAWLNEMPEEAREEAVRYRLDLMFRRVGQQLSTLAECNKREFDLGHPGCLIYTLEIPFIFDMRRV